MTEVEALQAVLAGAHAGVWGYAVAGAHLDDAAEDRARAAHAALRDLRDATTELLLARKAKPEAARPAYALPFAVEGADSARRLAVHLEDRLAPVLADLVAAARTPAVRTFGGDALTAGALRRIDWGADPVAFPGLA